MAKITLKNISSATVVVGTSDGSMRSRSLAPNRVITLTPTEYEDLMYEPGVQNMIRGGYIKIEGVEEKDQAEWLIRLGCDYLQGYFYSKPMPKKEFLDIMRKNKKVKHKMEKQNAN